MSEERFEGFVSRDSRGVSVLKSNSAGAQLLAGRDALRIGEADSEDDVRCSDIGERDLVRSVAASAGLSRGQARLAIESLFDAISGTLKNGNDV